MLRRSRRVLIFYYPRTALLVDAYDFSLLGPAVFLYYVLIAELYTLLTFTFSGLYFWADRSSRVRLMRSRCPAASWKDTIFWCLDQRIYLLQSILLYYTLFFIIPEPPDLNTRMTFPLLGLPFFLYYVLITRLYTPITFMVQHGTRE